MTVIAGLVDLGALSRMSWHLEPNQADPRTAQPFLIALPCPAVSRCPKSYPPCPPRAVKCHPCYTQCLLLISFMRMDFSLPCLITDAD